MDKNHSILFWTENVHAKQQTNFKPDMNQIDPWWTKMTHDEPWWTVQIRDEPLWTSNEPELIIMNQY